jgi:hypothetical protein
MRIKNFAKFQHFKDRTPPWVKLYRDILDDPDWHELDPAAAKVLVMLWLIASEDETKQGTLPPVKKLSFRLRISEKQLDQSLTKLSHWLEHDDIELISERYQHDAPETERETETETETETYKPEGEKEKRAPRFDALAHLVIIGVDLVIASDWIKHRQTLKAAPTLTAINGIETEAARAGISLADALAMCCQRGWRGFKAEWVKQEHANKPAYKSATDDRREFMAALTGKKPQQPAIVDLNVIEGESRHVA